MSISSVSPSVFVQSPDTSTAHVKKADDQSGANGQSNNSEQLAAYLVLHSTVGKMAVSQMMMNGSQLQILCLAKQRHGCHLRTPHIRWMNST